MLSRVIKTKHMKTLISKQFTLKFRDFSIGLIMAIGTPLLYLAQEVIPGWNADPFVKAGISAGITYLIKNFVEPTKKVTVETPKK